MILLGLHDREIDSPPPTVDQHNENQQESPYMEKSNKDYHRGIKGRVFIQGPATTNGALKNITLKKINY